MSGLFSKIKKTNGLWYFWKCCNNMKRGKRQRERLTSMSVVVQCAVQRAHQMDETRLAEANCVLLWKANEAMERKHLQHFKPFCCKVSALKASVSGFCTWVGRRCKQLFSSGFGLQPFLLLGFIAFPALLLLLCTRVLHRTHTWTRGLLSASTYAGLHFSKNALILSLHFFQATKPRKYRSKSNMQQHQAGKRTEAKPAKCSTRATLMGGTSMIFSTFCREQGTYHSAALLASFMAPASKDKRLNCWNQEQDTFIQFLYYSLLSERQT